MPLSDGDPAEDWDTWYRVVTVADHFKSDGTLHNKAFTGWDGVSAPPASRPWDFELSGRLLSLVAHAPTDCRQYCAKQSRAFSGVMYQKVEALRSDAAAQFAKTDVIYTPKPDNLPHADFTLKDTGVADLPAVREWLQSFIQVVKPDKADVLEALRPKPETVA